MGMGRPQGEIRQLLAAAIDTRGPSTARALADACCIGRHAASVTLNNMARSGEIVATHQVRLPHSRRPVNVYAASLPNTTLPAAPAAATLLAVWSTPIEAVSNAS